MGQQLTPNSCRTTQANILKTPKSEIPGVVKGSHNLFLGHVMLGGYANIVETVTRSLISEGRLQFIMY